MMTRSLRANALTFAKAAGLAVLIGLALMGLAAWVSILAGWLNAPGIAV